MQAGDLRRITGCSDPELKQWVREGVIVPLRPGRGSGVHADYDAANLVAVVLAKAMKEARIVVIGYASALAELQVSLRAQSSLKWGGLQYLMTPDRCQVLRRGALQDQPPCAVVMDVSALFSRLKHGEHEIPRQLELLRLQSVR